MNLIKRSTALPTPSRSIFAMIVFTTVTAGLAGCTDDASLVMSGTPKLNVSPENPTVVVEDLFQHTPIWYEVKSDHGGQGGSINGPPVEYMKEEDGLLGIPCVWIGSSTSRTGGFSISFYSMIYHVDVRDGKDIFTIRLKRKVTEKGKEPVEVTSFHTAAYDGTSTVLYPRDEYSIEIILRPPLPSDRDLSLIDLSDVPK